jgi:hypothetical protein
VEMLDLSKFSRVKRRDKKNLYSWDGVNVKELNRTSRSGKEIEQEDYHSY